MNDLPAAGICTGITACAALDRLFDPAADGDFDDFLDGVRYADAFLDCLFFFDAFPATGCVFLLDGLRNELDVMDRPLADFRDHFTDPLAALFLLRLQNADLVFTFLFGPDLLAAFDRSGLFDGLADLDFALTFFFDLLPFVPGAFDFLLDDVRHPAPLRAGDELAVAADFDGLLFPLAFVDTNLLRM